MYNRYVYILGYAFEREWISGFIFEMLSFSSIIGFFRERKFGLLIAENYDFNFKVLIIDFDFSLDL